MNCPYLSDEELEYRAMQLLADYERQEAPISKPPVPIGLIIENLLDIVIDWAPLPQSSSDGRTLASICVTPSGRRIVMNESELPFFDAHFGTVAYSEAHEVGHAVLHLPASLDQQASLLSEGEATVLCRSDLRDRREVQAERFASYLLMPEHLIRSAVADQDITSWPQIYRLRDSFRVSVTAMTLRLTKLNLAYVSNAGEVFPSREAATGQRRLY